MWTYLLFVFSMLFVSIGDVVAKRWVEHRDWRLFVFAISMYATCSVCWMPLMKAKGLIVATVVWAVMSIILSVAIACFYGETLTKMKICGLIAGLISVVLLNLSE